MRSCGPGATVSRVGEVVDKGVHVDIAPDPVASFFQNAESASAARQVAVDGDPVPPVGLNRRAVYGDVGQFHLGPQRSGWAQAYRNPAEGWGILP